MVRRPLRQRRDLLEHYGPSSFPWNCYAQRRCIHLKNYVIHQTLPWTSGPQESPRKLAQSGLAQSLTSSLDDSGDSYC